MLEALFTTSSELHKLGAIAHEEAIFVLPFIDKELTNRLVEVLVRRVLHPACLMVEVDYEKHTRKNNPDDQNLYTMREAQGFGGIIK